VADTKTFTLITKPFFPVFQKMK